MDFLIRKARIGDVKWIHSTMKRFAEQGEILPRSLSELYDHLRDFFVCIDEEKGPRGCLFIRGSHAGDL